MGTGGGMFCSNTMITIKIWESAWSSGYRDDEDRAAARWRKPVFCLRIRRGHGDGAT
jgi:hypothetical protein